MYAVEFQATLQNGMIPVPSQYQATLPANVRVIILLSAPEPRAGHEDFITKLLQAPRKVSHFKPMSREEVYER